MDCKGLEIAREKREKPGEMLKWWENRGKAGEKLRKWSEKAGEKLGKGRGKAEMAEKCCVNAGEKLGSGGKHAERSPRRHLDIKNL